MPASKQECNKKEEEEENTVRKHAGTTTANLVASV